MNARLNLEQSPANLGLLLPTLTGWRAVAVEERLKLGSAAGEGMVIGPGVLAEHCAVLPSAQGLLVIGERGPLTRPADPLPSSSSLRSPQPKHTANSTHSTCSTRSTHSTSPTRSAHPTTPTPSRPLRAGDVLRLARVPLVVVEHRRDAHGDWFGLGALGSWSPSLWPLLAELALVAGSAWPALLLGESGTGKELAARALHQASPRRHGPWVSVNCGALHGDLLLAELFGAEKGAYTGCTERRRGAFERADGGTLLLDELGELSPQAQAALLRVLEVGEVQVLGGATRKVDVRLVCATHRDLHSLVARGQFRLDLLHRVAVGTLRLPALRDRPEDLTPLMADWLEVDHLSCAVAERLRRHPWPGNLRELRNLARRLQLTSRCGTPSEREVDSALAELIPSAYTANSPMAVRTQAVRELLAQGLKPQQAWRHSGMSRAAFYRLLRSVRAETQCA
jgi:transcriptional regulator of acetoin/glycerol metabolism